MNDTTTTDQRPETHPAPPSVEPDWALQRLVMLTHEHGIELGLTLNLGGMLVSGTLINGRTWCEEMSQLIAAGTGNSPEVINGLSEGFRELGSNFYAADKAPDEPQIAYVHLRNAIFVAPNGERFVPRSGGVLWRGQLSQVAGFFLGQVT